MATIGLKGIWGLEQLDRTGIATWKLGILLMGGGALFGAILIPILGEVNPDSVLATSPRAVAFLLVSIPSTTGFALFFSLALARTTETDLRLLSSIDSSVNESVKRLQPTTRTLLISILFLMMFNFSLFPAEHAMTLNMTISESFSALHSSGLVLNVIYYPLVLVNGLAGGVLFSILITQSLSLKYTARQMKVDLLQLNHYSVIANPIVRGILLLLAGFSLFPPLILFADDPTLSTAMAFVALVSILGLVFPIFLLYAYPILILRNRIRDEKQRELNIVFQSLQGNDEAIKAITIQGRGVPTSTSDLLTHQMFVESRWEWPIASHVQKLILFGLLPPLTWVLAATIENALY